jgi:hypothetical protein
MGFGGKVMARYCLVLRRRISVLNSLFGRTVLFAMATVDKTSDSRYVVSKSLIMAAYGGYFSFCVS